MKKLLLVIVLFLFSSVAYSQGLTIKTNKYIEANSNGDVIRKLDLTMTFLVGSRDIVSSNGVRSWTYKITGFQEKKLKNGTIGLEYTCKIEDITVVFFINEIDVVMFTNDTIYVYKIESID